MLSLQIASNLLWNLNFVNKLLLVRPWKLYLNTDQDLKCYPDKLSVLCSSGLLAEWKFSNTWKKSRVLVLPKAETCKVVENSFPWKFYYFFSLEAGWSGIFKYNASFRAISTIKCFGLWYLDCSRFPFAILDKKKIGLGSSNFIIDRIPFSWGVEILCEQTDLSQVQLLRQHAFSKYPLFPHLHFRRFFIFCLWRALSNTLFSYKDSVFWFCLSMLMVFSIFNAILCLTA